MGWRARRGRRGDRGGERDGKPTAMRVPRAPPTLDRMVDKYLREPKQRLMRPLAARLPVAPAAVTVAALLTGVAAALAAAAGDLRAALALWLLNRLLDGLDGEVARHHGRQSDLGGYADLLADLLVYALLPIGLAFHADDPASWTALAWMLASFYLNGGSWMLLAAILEKRGRGAATGHHGGAERTSVTLPGGLVEGTETVLLYTVFLLLPQLLTLWFSLTAVLVLLTALQRFAWAARALREEP